MIWTNVLCWHLLCQLTICPSLCAFCINFRKNSCGHEHILAFGNMSELRKLSINLSETALVDFDIQRLVVLVASSKLRIAKKKNLCMYDNAVLGA